MAMFMSGNSTKAWFLFVPTLSLVCTMGPKLEHSSLSSSSVVS